MAANAVNAVNGPESRPVAQQSVAHDPDALFPFESRTRERAVKRRRVKTKGRNALHEAELTRGESLMMVPSLLDPILHTGRSKRTLPPTNEREQSGHSLLPPKEEDLITNVTVWERFGETMAPPNVAQSSDPEGSVVLDPKNSDRQYYREPFTGVMREIWRPGDGDGLQGTDYYQREGPPLDVEHRWRFFQSDIGPIGIGKDKLEPPRFVFLDDRAAYEVTASDIQRSHLNHNWPHDFQANAKIRARRVHCGRPAIKDPLTSEYHSSDITKTSRYIYSGQKDYKPIIYRLPEPQPGPPTLAELERKRKVEDAADPALYNARAHGHNQYTPKDQMVKYGAPTFSQKKPKGEDDAFLAELKAHKRTFVEPPSRTGSSNATSVLTRSYSGASGETGTKRKSFDVPQSPEMATFAQFKALDEAQASAADPSSYDFTKMTSPGQHQGSDGDSDSDIELFPKPTPTPTTRSVTTPASVASAHDLPRQMGFIERRDHEQTLAWGTMSSVHNEDDVMRIASELAEANVTIADQAKEIDRLKKALKDARSVIESKQGVIDAQGQLILEQGRELEVTRAVGGA